MPLSAPWTSFSVLKNDSVVIALTGVSSRFFLHPAKNIPKTNGMIYIFFMIENLVCYSEILMPRTRLLGLG